MDLGIRGKTAIVCAASQGLGRACAEALAEAGVDLIINARNADTLKATAKHIAQTYSVKVTPIRFQNRSWMPSDIIKRSLSVGVAQVSYRIISNSIITLCSGLICRLPASALPFSTSSETI